ncbi:GABA/polyamine transporter [Asimina triloba]
MFEGRCTSISSCHAAAERAVAHAPVIGKSGLTMMSSVKQSAAALAAPDLLRHRAQSPKLQLLSLPSISATKSPKFSLHMQKPLYLSSIVFGSIPEPRSQKLKVECEAYEADRSDNIHIPAQPVRSDTSHKVKIGIYFAIWWALNVVFNIYNKKVLNVFPFPWLTSTLSLATGSLMMLISWATGIVDAPKTDLDFWKALAPVAVAHTIGHVAATVSMAKVAVSFTHIIKSAEPAFSVLVSRFLLGETFPVPVYLSLVPIIGGCGLAALTELNFNMTGCFVIIGGLFIDRIVTETTKVAIKGGENDCRKSFLSLAIGVIELPSMFQEFDLGHAKILYFGFVPMGLGINSQKKPWLSLAKCKISTHRIRWTDVNAARQTTCFVSAYAGFMGAMISNLAFVFRNIFSKKGMKGKSVGGMNYYACLSMLSLVILIPFAVAVEGPKMWVAGWDKALTQIGPNFIWWVAAQSVFYHLYNQVSYMSLDEISPLTFSIGNTMKRISVIVSSIIIFRTPVQPINALGAAIAILGTFLYSQSICSGPPDSSGGCCYSQKLNDECWTSVLSPNDVSAPRLTHQKDAAEKVDTNLQLQLNPAHFIRKGGHDFNDGWILHALWPTVLAYHTLMESASAPHTERFGGYAECSGTCTCDIL